MDERAHTRAAGAQPARTCAHVAHPDAPSGLDPPRDAVASGLAAEATPVAELDAQGERNDRPELSP